MQMSIHVRSGAAHEGRSALKTAIHASVTYISKDVDGNALPTRQFVPVTEEDQRLAEHATVLRNLRAEYAPKPLVTPPQAQHVD